MVTSDFLDALITHTAELSTTDGNYATVRLRFLLRTQQAVEVLWNYDDWDFKKVVGGTMTLTSGNYYCVAPSGFHQIGNDGQVWIQNQNRRIYPKNQGFVNALRRASNGRSGQPDYYFVGSQDATTHRPKFVFDCLADQTYTLELDYEQTRPTLTDSSTPGSNGLDQVPDEHTRSVLLPAVIELISSDQGDGRVTTELGPRGMAMLKNMKAHRDQTRPEAERLGDTGLRLYGMH